MMDAWLVATIREPAATGETPGRDLRDVECWWLAAELRSSDAIPQAFADSELVVALYRPAMVVSRCPGELTVALGELSAALDELTVEPAAYFRLRHREILRRSVGRRRRSLVSHRR